MLRFGLSKDKKTFTANKFEGFEIESFDSQPSENGKVAVVLDVETTGLSHQADEIIEIAARKISFDPNNGQILELGEVFQSLQEASHPLSAEIQKLTGLSDKDLEGKSINWSDFDQFISEAVLIVAHNAYFDRPFVDKHSEVSAKTIWGCSASQIPWKNWFPSAKQEFLALGHGFFYNAHRSLGDVDALIKLLCLAAPDDSKAEYYFGMLIDNARKKLFRVFANNAPFESKDLLKQRRYKWLADKRVWSKQIVEDKLEDEKQFLSEHVYGGRGFLGKAQAIHPKDTFK